MGILQNIELTVLDNLPLVAPAHNREIVNDLLTRLFKDRLVVSNGPFLWPPHSPDLSVMDFYIWGAMKNKVFSSPSTIEKDYMERLWKAFRSLKPESIHAAIHENVRCTKCIEFKERNFEQYLK